MISTDTVRFVRYNSIKRPSKYFKTSGSLFYKATEIYTGIELNLKILEHKVFNKNIIDVLAPHTIHNHIWLKYLLK